MALLDLIRIRISNVNRTWDLGLNETPTNPLLDVTATKELKNLTFAKELIESRSVTIRAFYTSLTNSDE
jgi:hypothetical protein